MKRVMTLLTLTMRWTWQRTSAFVAVLLIVAAFALGLWVRGGGRREPTLQPNTATTRGAEPQMYACSMHPQVRLPDADAKCPICFMDLIPVKESDGGDGQERRIRGSP